jgi:hypothetical protein
MRNGLSYHRVLQRAWASTRVEVLTFQFVDLTIVPIASDAESVPDSDDLSPGKPPFARPSAMERAGHASPGEVCDLDAGGPQKFATILSQEAKQLLALDRYERAGAVTAQICDSSLR